MNPDILMLFDKAPGTYLIVTFGLKYPLAHPRIAEAVEPYPNRWTHHVLVRHTDKIDDEWMGWIDQSYQFARTKRRSRREQQP